MYEKSYKKPLSNIFEKQTANKTKHLLMTFV